MGKKMAAQSIASFTPTLLPIPSTATAGGSSGEGDSKKPDASAPPSGKESASKVVKNSADSGKGGGEQKQKKESEKTGKLGTAAATPSAATGDEADPSKLDLRVGVIKKCWDHPEREKLLCEEIDVGEENVRTIASGIRAHYKAEEMVGKKVIVVCNLKDAKMGTDYAFKSQGACS